MKKEIIKNLNKFQNRAISAIIKGIKKENKCLVKMATGTGKTEVMVKLVKKYSPNRTLICTHLTDLIDQTFTRFHNYGYYDCSIFDGRAKDLNSSIVIAGVKSLGKQSILKNIKKDHFDLIIMDEAHHAAAGTYIKILNHFDAPRIGLTATPARPDGLDIQEHFGEVNNILDFEVAQKNNILAKSDAYVILTNSVIEGAPSQNGEYTNKTLEKTWTSVNRNDIIIDSYLEKRQKVIKAKMKPKTICFCINVKHAKRMSKLFNSVGIRANYIVGDRKELSYEKREELVTTFRDTNKIEVMCVVGLLGEGSDIPDANIALMTRPTRSPIVYAQQIGRVSRVDGGRKGFFLVLDFVDVTRKNYQSYIMSNLMYNAGINKSKIIVKYVKSGDKIKLNERVENIMNGYNNFEKASLDYNKLTNDEKEMAALIVLEAGE